uniref:Neuronal vesicle trafficking-associated protein 1 n=1 Tax=Rousettus aegyptiacus TaxID=9407 RepID=A0A7J8E9A8_ROUAE|nr:neuronal vesicle trafficking associated 1 [Rousettus aegyptiacus]
MSHSVPPSGRTCCAVCHQVLTHISQVTPDPGRRCPVLLSQVSVLVFFALAFLTCVVFLVVYKVYKHERLCPDGSILKNAQCIPDGLAAYYAEQDAHAPDRFYAVVNHYNLAKQSAGRSLSPWMSVLSEEKLSEQETEAAEKSA